MTEFQMLDDSVEHQFWLFLTYCAEICSRLRKSLRWVLFEQGPLFATLRLLQECCEAEAVETWGLIPTSVLTMLWACRWAHCWPFIVISTELYVSHWVCYCVGRKSLAIILSDPVRLFEAENLRSSVLATSCSTLNSNEWRFFVNFTVGNVKEVWGWNEFPDAKCRKGTFAQKVISLKLVSSCL